jgi:hypothetical protein
MTMKNNLIAEQIDRAFAYAKEKGVEIPSELSIKLCRESCKWSDALGVIYTYANKQQENQQ